MKREIETILIAFGISIVLAGCSGSAAEGVQTEETTSMVETEAAESISGVENTDNPDGSGEEAGTGNTAIKESPAAAADINAEPDSDAAEGNVTGNEGSSKRNSAESPETDIVISSDADISNKLSLTLSSDTYTLDSLKNVTVTLKNDSAYEVTAGEDYELQKLQDGQWVPVPISAAWDDIGIIIAPDSSRTFTYDLSNAASFESWAQYRLVKKVYLNQTEYAVYGIFSVTG